MIPMLDLQAQYRSIKPEIDAAVAQVFDSGHFVLGGEVAAVTQDVFADDLEGRPRLDDECYAVLTQAPPRDERRLSALTPLGVLLPVVLVGPVAYVAGRILLG